LLQSGPWSVELLVLRQWRYRRTHRL